MIRFHREAVVPDGPFVCVVDILTGDILYLGKFEFKAATALNPGTVFAKDRVESVAKLAAKASAREFRENGYTKLENTA